MKRVYTSPNLAEAVLMKDVLGKAGIQTMLKNSVLSGGLSFTLGYTDTWPEVWVFNDEDTEKALVIVNDWLQESHDPVE